MSTTWNTDAAANKLKKTYIQGFLDVSGGNMTLRNSSFEVYDAHNDRMVYQVNHEGFKVSVGGSTVDVSYAQFAQLTSLGLSFENTTASINSRYQFVGSTTTNGNVTIVGISGPCDLTVYGTLKTSNFYNNAADLYIAGDTTLNKNLYVTEDVSLNKQLYVNGNTTLSKNLYVGQDASLNQNLYVTGRTTIGAPPTNASYELDICGQMRIYEVVGSNVTTNTSVATLTLEHGDASGASSIMFKSPSTTSNGDYAYIKYQDFSGATTNRSLLTIGIENDPTATATADRISMYAAGGSGFVGVNTLTPQHSLDVCGNARISGIVYNNYVEPTATSAQMDIAVTQTDGSLNIGTLTTRTGAIIIGTGTSSKVITVGSTSAGTTTIGGGTTIIQSGSTLELGNNVGANTITLGRDIAVSGTVGIATNQNAAGTVNVANGTSSTTITNIGRGNAIKVTNLNAGTTVDISAAGELTLRGSSITVNGPTKFNSDISLSQNVKLGSGSNSIAVNKDISSQYALDVSGATIFRGSTQLIGDVSLNQNLNVTGRAMFGAPPTTTAYELDVSGQMRIFETGVGSIAGTSTGTLVLEHGLSGGASSLVLKATNSSTTSDYAYIQYEDNTGFTPAMLKYDLSASYTQMDLFTNGIPSTGSNVISIKTFPADASINSVLVSTVGGTIPSQLSVSNPSCLFFNQYNLTSGSTARISYMFSTSSIIPFSTGFTFSAWIRPTTVSAANCRFYILNISPNSATSVFDIYIDGDTNQIVALCAEDVVNCKVTTTLTANIWRHYVFTFDNATSTGNHYLDGALVPGGVSGNGYTSKTLTTAIGQIILMGLKSQFATGLQIGTSGKFAKGFNGHMNYIHMFDRAVTAADIAVLYNTPGYTQTSVERGLMTIGIENDASIGFSDRIALMPANGSGFVGVNTKTPTAHLDVSGTINVSGNLVVTSGTASTSTSTGALQITGGAGIGGNLFVGGSGSFSVSNYSSNNFIGGNVNLTLPIPVTNAIFANLTTINSNSVTIGAITPSFYNGVYDFSASSFDLSLNGDINYGEPFKAFNNDSQSSWISSRNGGSRGYNQSPYSTTLPFAYQGGTTSSTTTNYFTTVVSGTPISGEWLQIKVPTAFGIMSYSLNKSQTDVANSHKYMPSEFYLAGSNNGTSWSLIDYRNENQNLVKGNNSTYSFDFNFTLTTKSENYTHFRLISTKLKTGTSGFVSIGDLYLYGEPVGYSMGKTTITTDLQLFGKVLANDTEVSGNMLFRSRAKQDFKDVSFGSMNGFYALDNQKAPITNIENAKDAVSSWTPRFNPSAVIQSICWSSTLRIFCAVGTNKAYTSPDGINWTTSDISSNASLAYRDVVWAPELNTFCAVATGSTSANSSVALSSNGTTWNTNVTHSGSNGFYSVSWSPELKMFNAIGFDSTSPANGFMYSYDGLTWTSINPGNTYYSGVWANSLKRFVFIQTNGTISLGTYDGKNFTVTFIPLQNALYNNSATKLVWSPELNMLVAFGGNTLFTSYDGLSWTMVKNLALTQPTNCTWSAELGVFNVMDAASKCYISNDGINWSSISISATLTNSSTSSKQMCWSPDLGIFCFAPGANGHSFLTSSLSERIPTAYNLFNSNNGIQSVDQNGNWTFNKNATVSGRVGLGMAPSTTFELDVSGQMRIFETGAGSKAGIATGSLVLEHNDASGASSIVFRSKNNATSDYAYIQYEENVGGTGVNPEKGLLTIGIENESGSDNSADRISLFSAGGSGFVGVNTKTPTAHLDVSGNTRVTGDTQILGKVGLGMAPSTTFELDVSGQMRIFETGAGSKAGIATGSLVLEHSDASGASSIVFRSKNNAASDYAYIQYEENVGGTGVNPEKGLLTIGIENESGSANSADRISLFSACGSGFVGVNTKAPTAHLDVSGSFNVSNYSSNNFIGGNVNLTLPIPVMNLIFANSTTINSNSVTINSVTPSFYNGVYDFSASSFDISDNYGAPFKAFDETVNTAWLCGIIGGTRGYTQKPYSIVSPYEYQGGTIGSTTTNYFRTVVGSTTISGEWLQIKLPTAFSITKYSISRTVNRFSIENSLLPKEFYLVGSNNGTTWTQLDFRNEVQNFNPSVSNTVEMSFTINKTIAYTYFRIITTKIVGDGIVAIHSFRLFGEPAGYSMGKTTVTNDLQLLGKVISNDTEVTGNMLFSSRVKQDYNDASYSSMNGFYALDHQKAPVTNIENAKKAVSTWSAVYTPGTAVYSVCWSSTLRIFCAVGGIKAYTSPNGMNWAVSDICSNTAIGYVDVVWAPELGIFCAVARTQVPDFSKNLIATSSNGVSWNTNITHVAVGEPNGLSAIAWSPELRMFNVIGIYGGNMFLYSYDGINWTSNVSPSNYFAVVWARDLKCFIFSNQFGNMQLGNSTGTWFVNETALTSLQNGSQPIFIMWSSELKMLVGYGGSKLYTSYDGLRWRTVPNFTFSNNSGYIFGTWSAELGIFLFIEPVSKFCHVSSNGIDWSSFNLPSLPTNAFGNFLGKRMCWSPELGIFCFTPANSTESFTISSLTERIPTAYNLFNSNNGIQSVDQTGNWTFNKNTTVSGNSIVNGTLVTNTIDASNSSATFNIANNIRFGSVTLNSNGSSSATTTIGGGTINIYGSGNMTLTTGYNAPQVSIITGARTGGNLNAFTGPISGSSTTTNVLTGTISDSAVVNIASGQRTSATLNLGSGDVSGGTTNVFSGKVQSSTLNAFNGDVSNSTYNFLNGNASNNAGLSIASGSRDATSYITIDGGQNSAGSLYIGNGNNRTGSINIGDGAAAKNIFIGGHSGLTYLAGGSLRIKDQGAGTFFVGRIPGDTISDNIAVYIAGGVNTSGNVSIMNGSGSTGNVFIGRDSAIKISNLNGGTTVDISAAGQLTLTGSAVTVNGPTLNVLGKATFGATTTSSYQLDVSGQMRIYEPVGTVASDTSGSLILEHANARGTSSIMFKGPNSVTKDYAYVQYEDNVAPVTVFRWDLSSNSPSPPFFTDASAIFSRGSNTTAKLLAGAADFSLNWQLVSDIPNAVPSSQYCISFNNINIRDLSRNRISYLQADVNPASWSTISTSLWIKPSVVTDPTNNLNNTSYNILDLSGTTSHALAMFINRSRLSVVLDGSTNRTNSLHTDVAANTWYHIVFSYDAITNTAALYKNNVLQQNVSGGFTSSFGSFNAVALGWRPGFSDGSGVASTVVGAQKGFAGQMYSVNIFNEVLTPTDVSNLYWNPVYNKSVDQGLLTIGIENDIGYKDRDRIVLWPSGGKGFVGINTKNPQYTLDVSGNIQAFSYNATSDYRAKDDVVPLNAAYTVDALNPVTYIFKATGKQDVGFIAHEVQEFYPFLVNGEKDGATNQSLNYNGLIGILTKEIKDLKVKVSYLEANALDQAKRIEDQAAKALDQDKRIEALDLSTKALDLSTKALEKLVSNLVNK